MSIRVTIQKGTKVHLWIQGQTRPLQCRVEEVDESGWPQVVEVLGGDLRGRRLKRSRMRWAVVVFEEDVTR